MARELQRGSAALNRSLCEAWGAPFRGNARYGHRQWQKDLDVAIVVLDGDVHAAPVQGADGEAGREPH
eukprot:1675319-Prymnesium_polylepis.1